MKCILIFSLAYFPKHVGGAEVAIKEITDRIKPIFGGEGCILVPEQTDPVLEADFDIIREGLEFHMITLRFDSTLPKTEKIGNVLVHRISFTKKNATMADLRKFPLHLNKFFYQFLAPLYALRLHRKYHYSGAWAMMAHSCGVPTTLFNMFTGVPYVQTLQEGDPIPYIMKKVRLVYPLFVRAFRSASVIQAISTYLANWAHDMGATCPIVVVPNAVNTKHFSQTYAEEELDALRTKLGKKEGERYIITTSRLVPKNAVDVVIRALALLPEHITFLVLGIGPDEAELKKLARSTGVADRVRFLGQVEHAELPKYLQISDVFTRPSRSEGMGNSFVEAMASGIPVVATAEGGITDFLFDLDMNPEKEPTGLFAKTGDSVDTARQLKRFLDDDALRSRCVENARRMVIKTYDWDLIAQHMRQNVFATLLAKKAL